MKQMFGFVNNALLMVLRVLVLMQFILLDYVARPGSLYVSVSGIECSMNRHGTLRHTPVW
jgi:hypothetical protein